MSTKTEFITLDAAASAVLQFLQDRYGFGLWMVTRVMPDRWTVLAAIDNRFGVKAGETFESADSGLLRVVHERGPQIARRCEDLPAYIDASIPSRFDINAYIGVPLRTDCGRFFGTLCAIDNVEHPEIDDAELPLLELLGGLLVGYIRNEIASNEQERQDERFRFEVLTDSLTHLPNRSAWEKAVENEKQRSRRLGDTTFISIIDLIDFKEINKHEGPEKGDELLRKTALALRYAVRNSDFLARVRDDEFAVLGNQCDSIDPDDVSARLRSSLENVGISISVGTAVGRPSDSYRDVWDNANAAMRRDRKAARLVGWR